MRAVQPHETLDMIQRLTDLDVRLFGLDYLREFAIRVVQEFDLKRLWLGQLSETHGTQFVTTVVYCDRTGLLDNTSYSTEGTPCANVASGCRVCIYDEDLIAQFPEDAAFQEWGAVSYVGAPVLGAEGHLSALLGMVGDSPITTPDFYRGTGSLVASLMAAELERAKINKLLHQQVRSRTLALEESKEQLHSALDELQTLRGIIPMCAWCRKIRDDDGYYKRVEDYLSAHSHATVSHGICPDCRIEVTSKRKRDAK